MKEIFYVAASQDQDNVIDKEFESEDSAVKWGEDFASEHPDYIVSLYVDEVWDEYTERHFIKRLGI